MEERAEGIRQKKLKNFARPRAANANSLNATSSATSSTSKTRSRMRSRRAQIHLPPLDAGHALTVVSSFERATDALWRAHGHSMAELQSLRAEATRSRRRPTPAPPTDSDDRLFCSSYVMAIADVQPRCAPPRWPSSVWIANPSPSLRGNSHSRAGAQVPRLRQRLGALTAGDRFSAVNQWPVLGCSTEESLLRVRQRYIG
jgi:hypothetical protein